VRHEVAELPAEHLARVKHRLAWCAASLLMTGVLLAPALWNQFPILQYDTGGYLARWYEGYLVPSRPAAYGLLLSATVPFHFWPVLLIQAAATIWVLALVLREFGLGGRPFLLLTVVVSLSGATTLPWLTSILLTDIFAGLAVMGLYLLVLGRTLRRTERYGLVAFIAFAMATHSATLALLAALTVCIAGLAWLRGSMIAPARARLAGAALVLGVVMTLSANYVVSSRFAFTPGGYGILFGRMLQDGIVSRYLDDHCPNTKLKLCPVRKEIPRNADAFLWGNSVFNDLGRFAGLGEEMRTIVLGSLRAYPWMQIETAVVATARQLTKVASGQGVIHQLWHTYGIMERFTPGIVPAMRAARQQRGEIAFATINRLHVPIGLATAALLPLLVFAGLRWARLSGLGRFAAAVALALLVNAFVCGALANPHDRYGARLIWLAVLTVGLAPLCAFARVDTGARTPAAVEARAAPAFARVREAAGA
jgi:hypothetical protein